MKVTGMILVSDKMPQVIMLEHADEFKNTVARMIGDQILYHGASQFQVRALVLDVPPLETPEPRQVDASQVVTMDTDFQAVVDEFRTRHGQEEATRLQDRLLEVLPPGTWEVYRSCTNTGIHKIK